ncbi:MAG: methyltransferase domain-containing protein [Sulfuricellaceae bacterium]
MESLDKNSFDAALLPGIRAELAEAYRAFRHDEAAAISSWLGPDGCFAPGTYFDRPCPLCGSGSAAHYLFARGLDIVSCDSCGLVYSRNVLLPEVDRLRYENDPAAVAHVALRQSPAYRRLEEGKLHYLFQTLAGLGARDGELLDIGAADGRLLVVARNYGWAGRGIELNRGYRNVHQELGLAVSYGAFPEDYSDDGRRFALVTMLDVLEHTVDPVGFLRHVGERLTTEGLIAVQVPNVNSLLLRLEGAANNNFCPGHWNYFSAASLQKAGAAAGLRAIHQETYITELDRILSYDREKIRQAFGRDLPVEGELAPELLHRHLQGYKLFTVFAKE